MTRPVTLTPAQWAALAKLRLRSWCISKRTAVALLRHGVARISTHCDEAGHFPLAINQAGRAALAERGGR